MKLVKIAAAVVGGLLVLAVAAVLTVAWLFDPNDYKDTLATEFERRTGRTLVIGRDLELEYVPWLAVETGGVVVGNAQGFSERDFARIETLAARVELLPLLQGQVRIGTIVLDGLVLNLETDAAGRGNWLLETGEPQAEAAAGADASPAPNGLGTLDVDGLRVRNGAATYRALGTSRELTLDELSVTTGAYASGEPVTLEGSFALADSATGTSATITTEGTLEYAGTLIALRDWRIELDVSAPDAFAAGGEVSITALEWRTGGALTASGASATGWIESAALGGRRDVAAAWRQAELVPATGALGIDALTTSVGDVTARWQVSGSSLLGADGRIAGSVALEPTSLEALARAAAVELPDDVDAAALGELALSSEFSVGIEPLVLDLTGLEARALGATMTGNASFDARAPRVTARLDVPEFAPSDALRALAAPHVPAGITLDAFERIALATEITANPDAGTIALRDLRIGVLGATLTGNVDVAGRGGNLTASGRLASSEITPRAFQAAFGELLTDTIDRRELGALSFDAGFRYAAGTDELALDPLSIDVFGLSASGTLTASALSTAPVYTGRASVERFPPRELMRRFGQTPPETSDPAALGTAGIDTRFEITAERGTFRELVLRLDDSRITGEFTVEDFENPAYRFALAIDTLDADRYMAPPADEVEQGERAAGDLALDGEALDVLDLNGRAEIGTLRLAGLGFANVSTRIALGDGAFRLDDAAAELYGGRFAGAFGVDATGDTPAMTLTGRAERLDLAPLITDLTGDANFSGTADFDLALSGTGVTVTENVRSATGTMGFAMRSGAIEGFDLGRALCAAYNTTQQLPRPPDPDVERTRYELLRGTAQISGGVAHSPDLLARASFMDVTGAGSIDLVEQQIDYELEATLTAPIGIPRCESMDRLVGDSIPLTLRGTIEEPQIRPDFGEILKRRVQDELRDRATDSLEERVRDRLRDLL